MTLCYLKLNIFIGNLKFQDNDAPLPHVFRAFGWTVAVYAVTFGSIVGLIACLIGAIFRKHCLHNQVEKMTEKFFSALPRIVYAMAEDGLLFEVFAKVHPKFKTPCYGILIAGFLTATLSAVFDVNQLVNMISIGTVSEN